VAKRAGTREHDDHVHLGSSRGDCRRDRVRESPKGDPAASRKCQGEAQATHPERTGYGAVSEDGTFHPLETWDGDAVMKLFRERLLARLIERHAISEELAQKLLNWRHPEFSAHIGEPIPFEDKKAIEDVASNLVKA